MPCINHETSIENDEGAEARRYGEEKVRQWCLEVVLKWG